MSARGLRTVTVTFSPPSRSAVRQQSIAVLPPPMTTTRRPILLGMAEGDGCQQVDADMDVRRGLLAAGNVQVLAARARRCR